MADSTQFTIDLGVAGSAGVDSAANSVAALESRLVAASSAAAKAADAVKAQEASYKSAEAAYDRASKALEKINVAMQTASGSQLAKLQARQNEAAAAADKARAAMQGEAAALDKLKASSSAASATQEKLKKQLDGEKKAAEAAAKAAEASRGSGNLKKLGGALRDLGGPLGTVGNSAAQFGDTVEDLMETLGSGIGLFAGVTVGIVALTAAVVAGVAAFAAWAVKGADAARSQQLLLQGITQSVEGGKDLAAQIDDLANRVPQTSEELQGMAADLAKTGLKGDALADALENAATKAAQAKFGPEWPKQMLSLTKQGTKLKSILDRLFANLKIDKVLEGIDSLVSLFDKGEASSNALTTVWNDLVQGLVDGVANFLPKVRTAFIQFEILVLKALIAIKPFGSTILFVAEAVGVTAAAIIGLLVGALVVVTGLIVGAIAVIYKLVTSLSDAGVAFGQWLKSLGDVSLIDIGINLIEGLVTGITGAGPKVLESLKGIVTGAIDGTKKLLRIGSPSKVFAEIGMNTAEGMAQGVDGSAPAVQGSLESMVSPPDAGASASLPSASSGGNTFSITINAGGSGEANDIADAVRQVLLDILEGNAQQLGAANA